MQLVRLRIAAAAGKTVTAGRLELRPHRLSVRNEHFRVVIPVRGVRKADFPHGDDFLEAPESLILLAFWTEFELSTLILLICESEILAISADLLARGDGRHR